MFRRAVGKILFILQLSVLNKILGKISALGVNTDNFLEFSQLGIRLHHKLSTKFQ